jgi:hypothetical protein
MTSAIRSVAAFAALAGVMFAQTIGKTPATDKFSLQSAMEEAGHALQRYQATLASLRDLPEMDTTVREDSQVVLSGRNSVDWLRGKAELEGAVDAPEFEGLLDSIDACAANAALSSSVLAAGAARTGSKRKLRAAKDLLSNSEQLQNAIKHVRQALKPYVHSEKPPRIV